MNKNYCVCFERDRPIINVLGEICWGFKVDDFENKIGARKEVVEGLLKRLLKEEKERVSEAYLDDSEVKVVRQALKEVEQEIEEWEFCTRIGVSIEEIRLLPIFYLGE